MELEKLKAMMAQSQQENHQIISAGKSSQAIQKILKTLQSEMFILIIFALISVMFNRVLIQQSQQYFSIYLFALSIFLMVFLGYFYLKIKNQNRKDISLREVLENQIKSIKLFMKIYYLSTFFILSISLIISVLILGFVDEKLLNLQFFWKKIAFLFCLISLTTLWLVKWWLAKFYQKPLIELEKNLTDLTN